MIDEEINFLEPNQSQNFQKSEIQTKWWSYRLEDVFKQLNSGEKGLSEKEAKDRQKFYGLNSIPTKKEIGFFGIVWGQLKSFLIIVLIVAALISMILGEKINAGVILVGVFVNLIFGAWQERKTSKLLKSLSASVANFAIVIREGEEKSINAKDLSPGDIVSLSAGDKVPADIRLFKTLQLKIDEALLTGESEPREKDARILQKDAILAERKNMAFSGTMVVEGKGIGVVAEIGQNSELGRISQMLYQIKEEKTPLQKKMDWLAVFLTRVVLALSFFVLIFGLIFNYSFITMFTMAIAIAVSAIPEGLAVIATVVLAIGMRKILERGALVKKLLGAEVLGSTDVICVDKTGTITEGNMKISKIYADGIEFDFDDEGKKEKYFQDIEMFLLRIGALCNDSYPSKENNGINDKFFGGNLTDRALLLSASKKGIKKEELEKEFERLDEIPFNSENRFMMTIHKGGDKRNIVYAKGAPEQILLFSDFAYDHKLKKQEKMTEGQREKIIKNYEKMSKDGLRVIALCYKEVPPNFNAISDTKHSDSNSAPKNKISIADTYTNFIFVGLLGIKDPVRAEVKETIKTVEKAGVKTIMITGDNKFTAKNIGKEIGLETKEENMLTGKELDEISQSDLKERVKKIQIYARTTPEQKLKIVQAWQENGMVVAMTGDGINDAPAIKQADIGISLGGGNDVAKETADIILLDNNFKNIIEAVKQGRVIFANIKKVVLYLLSDSLCEVFIVIGAIFMKLPLPVLASQIIWVNLIDDILPAIALARDGEMENVMTKENKKTDILDKENKALIFFTSLAGAVSVLAIFLIFWKGKEENYVLANSIAFALLGMNTLFFVFCVRDIKKPFWRVSWIENRALLYAVLVGIFMQVSAIHIPFLQNIFKTTAINLFQWVFVIVASFVVIFIVEFVKWIFNRQRVSYRNG
jgi:Ca2+-transporting ATPase